MFNCIIITRECKHASHSYGKLVKAKIPWAHSQRFSVSLFEISMFVKFSGLLRICWDVEFADPGAYFPKHWFELHNFSSQLIWIWSRWISYLWMLIIFCMATGICSKGIYYIYYFLAWRCCYCCCCSHYYVTGANIYWTFTICLVWWEVLYALFYFIT